MKLVVWVMTFGLVLAILAQDSWAQTPTVSETTAGYLYRLFGQRPFEEQPIPLATLTVTAKHDVESIGIFQGESLNCPGGCPRNPESDRLWLLIRFKDNSQARIELTVVERDRIEFLYSKSAPEAVVRSRVVTFGPHREPVLVKTFEQTPSQFQRLQDPKWVAETIGFQLIRVYSSQSKRLSREVGMMVTTGIRAESVRR